VVPNGQFDRYRRRCGSRPEPVKDEGDGPLKEIKAKLDVNSQLARDSGGCHSGYFRDEGALRSE